MNGVVPLTAPQRVFAMFAIYAFSMGSIFPRLGDIQRGLGVEEGALGMALMGTPVGTFVSLTFAAPLLERLGLRSVVLFGLPLLAGLYAVAVQASSTLAFFLLLLPVGLVIGCIEILLNVEADRTEHQVAYRIMNRAHAFWSIGFFIAGGLGAVLASAGISPQLHLACVAIASTAAVLLLLRDFRPAAKRLAENNEGTRRFAAPTSAILLLVAFTVSAMLLEGGSMDWSAIYMRDTFLASPFLSGIAVAVFAASQAVARYFADIFIDRTSPAKVARTMLFLLFVGCAVVVASPNAQLSIVGFALMGLGTSVIFPLAMSAAAQRQDRPAVLNVAALAQLSFMMFLVGPPLLGFVAEHWGLRLSYALALPLILLSFATTHVLVNPRHGK
ncbi:ProP Permeases of the major facilitator superfamily [Paracoccaceae bacterium]